MTRAREIAVFFSLLGCLSSSGADAAESESEVHVSASTGCRLEISHSGQRTITCPSKFTLSSVDARIPLIDKLARVAGSGAVECGVVGLGDSKDDALACARDSDNNNRAFWVAFQREGFDSEAWTGAALSIDLERTVWNYDSNPSGSWEVNPHFQRYDCGSLEINPALVAVIVCGSSAQQKGEDGLPGSSSR